MRFEFSTVSKIVFGQGTVREVVPAAQELGRNFLLVRGADNAAAGLVRDLFIEQGIKPGKMIVRGEPVIEEVLAGLDLIRKEGVDVIVAVGGGSAIDAAKAVAVLAANPGGPLDYLEVIGKGRGLVHPGLPVIAVPTTAGTGSEVTRNAVLTSPEHKMKVSLRGAHLLPKIAIVDPELCLSLPGNVTASTGMDAFAQVLEPFVSSRSNPLADLYCKEGLVRAGRSLLRAYRDGKDLSARTDMSFASLMGGLALANAGLGAVHGFASPLGGMFDAPHGAICACLLAPVVQVNLHALKERAPLHPAIGKYAEAARLATGNPNADANDLLELIQDMRTEMHIPSLREYGIQQGDLGEIVAKAAAASSMRSNPVALSESELRTILQTAL